MPTADTSEKLLPRHFNSHDQCASILFLDTREGVALDEAHVESRFSLILGELILYDVSQKFPNFYQNSL